MQTTIKVLEEERDKYKESETQLKTKNNKLSLNVD